MQVITEAKTKDASVQCTMHTHATPITKDASVQCRLQPFVTSSPIHDLCSGSTESELSDLEVQDHIMDTSGYTVSPGSTSS